MDDIFTFPNSKFHIWPPILQLSAQGDEERGCFGQPSWRPCRDINHKKSPQDAEEINTQREISTSFACFKIPEFIRATHRHNGPSSFDVVCLACSSATIDGVRTHIKNLPHIDIDHLPSVRACRKAPGNNSLRTYSAFFPKIPSTFLRDLPSPKRWHWDCLNSRDSFSPQEMMAANTFPPPFEI